MLFRFGAFCAQVAALLSVILHKAPLGDREQCNKFLLPNNIDRTSKNIGK